MKRRSKAGNKPVKAPRRKALKPKRDAPKAVAHSDLSNAGQEIAVARLTRELNETLERLTSMSEVLGVISRSKFELQPLLQSVAVNAARLCRADGAAIFRLESGLYPFVAGYSLNPAELEIERLTPIPPGTVRRPCCHYSASRSDRRRLDRPTRYTALAPGRFKGFWRD